jgi:hypothetical protein
MPTNRQGLKFAPSTSNRAARVKQWTEAPDLVLKFYSLNSIL